MFYSMKCICGQRWTRQHIPCLPTITLTPDLEAKFNDCRIKFSKNFSKLDFLLNNQKWDQVIRVLDIWQGLLSKKS